MVTSVTRRIFLFLALVFVCVPLGATAADNCQPFIDMRIRGVSTQKVRETWLSWQNAERKKLGLKPLALSPQLNRTAVNWSRSAAEKGTITHKRDPKDGYYNYVRITDWFADLGLTFLNTNRKTFSESIGWGPYKCTTGNCTEKMIAALRTTFDFYMAEKNKADRPHYNAIIAPEFTQIGMGVAQKDGKYFVTTHYAAGFANDPLPLCRVRTGLRT